MLFHSAIALTALVISVTALVGDAGAQYAPVYGQPSPPRPYAAIPRPKQSDEIQIPGLAEAHPNYGSLPPEDQPETDAKGLPPEFQRQLVSYQTTAPAGTIIIDTPNTYLYLVLGHGRALRYGVGVGREGFTWAGTQRIARMVEWPDWHPPTGMIDRQPYLPRFMAGGPGNPLGARALYLGNTLYRIHGTNQPSTIGQFAGVAALPRVEGLWRGCKWQDRACIGGRGNGPDRAPLPNLETNCENRVLSPRMEMSRSLLNIEKLSLPRLMLSGVGLASKDAV